MNPEKIHLMGFYELEKMILRLQESHVPSGF